MSQKLTIHQNRLQKKLFKTHIKRSRKRIVRYGLLTANVALLVGVVFFVVGANGSGETTRLSAVSSNSEVSDNPLDQVSSADIAVHVAHLTSLPELRSVENHADSFNALLTMPTATDSSTVVPKPQIVSTPSPKTKKDITTYTTVAGDTIASVAEKFGVNADSIRWSNSINGNTVAAGKQLTIPPINGVVYVVKSGDTVDSLASKYNANKDQISEFNDAEIAGIKVGESIVIPNGTLPAPRSSSVSSGSGSGAFAWGGYTAVYSSNGYDYGWCTWWAAKRRADIGRPIPSNLGNATTWASLARRAGLPVDGTPAAGDVAYYRTIGGLGHVGFVEQVNPDGSIWISDMNYTGVSQIGGSAGAGGWGRTSYHLVTPEGSGANGISGFYFIH